MGSLMSFLILLFVKGTITFLGGLIESSLSSHHPTTMLNALYKRSDIVEVQNPLMLKARSSAKPTESTPFALSSKCKSFDASSHKSGERHPPCGQPLAGMNVTVPSIKLDVT